MKFLNSLIFFFVYFFLHIHVSLSMISDEEKKELGKVIVGKENIEKEKIKISALPREGSGNNGIYEIQIEGNFYIGKALKDLSASGEGTQEEQIKKYIQLHEEIISTLSEVKNFPRFVRYIGNLEATLNKRKEQILVLEKAKGISLKEFGQTRDFDTEIMKQHLKQIGTVLGNFHNSGWSHGDFRSGSNNIFYDSVNFNVILIDYGGLQKKTCPNRTYAVAAYRSHLL